MYEIDFLPVGDGERSGDAIALRYTPPGEDPIVGVIDAGFESCGEALVAHIHKYYDTNRVAFVISTHPDEDHINGMGIVMRELDVANLLVHRPALHGHPSNSGAKPAEELVKLAEAQNAKVIEPFAGVNGFGNSLLIAGPTQAFYETTLDEQTQTTKSTPKRSLAARYGAPVLAEIRKALSHFPIERDFDDAGGTNPRNNSAAIVSLMIDGEHKLFTSDAGIPAITPALDYLDGQGRMADRPSLFTLPHHGSRHNLDLETIERILGDHTDSHRGLAVASVSEASKNPSPRVANAAGRRGYRVLTTSGKALCDNSSDAPMRNGWVPAVPLQPLVEDDHDD